MKEPFFRPSAQALLRAVTTLCVALGCVDSLCLSLGLAASGSFCALCCAGVTALLALFDCMPRLRALAYPALLACVAALVLRNAGQAQSIAAALTLFVNGQPLALAAYSRTIVLLLALLGGGLGALIASSEQALFPLACLTAAMVAVVSLSGADAGTAAILPFAAALLLCARAPGVRVSRILPCAALILLLCTPLLPFAGRTLPQFEETASRLRQAIDDYFFFTDPRTTASLASTGYQPLGPDRLGGPASPTDMPVMLVHASGRALLRGTIKNEYTGAAWRDAISGRRYLLVNPRFYALRRNLFDLGRPSRALRERYLPAETISVSFLSGADSTLFLTQRFSSLTGEGIVPYYSPASEVFATHSLAEGEHYAFSGSRLTADSPLAREAVLAAFDESDPYAETVRATYAQLPPGIEEGVYALALQYTEGAENDFDRALAICRHLQSDYRYTLEQSVPPEGRDFVSWFLLTERKGYCTSYASAMAVLARIAGLSARYIEGYAANPDADGVACVVQRDAHAWVEIYFPGFGWMSFDPTPGMRASGPGEGENDAPDGGETPPPSGTPTPSPTASPTPEPTPTPTPSPTPENGDPAATPTPEITPQPTPIPTPEPTPAPTPSAPPDAPDEDEHDPLWWPLALLLLLVLLSALRLWLASPARVARSRKNAADALLVWYRAVEALLACMGLSAMPGEAPATFLARAQERLGGKPALEPLGRALYAARYSGRRINPAQVERAEKLYADLLRGARPQQRLRLYVSRLLHGANYLRSS